MDVTQLALTWVGWPNGEKHASTNLRANWISTKVSAESSQVNTSARKAKRQVDNLRVLATPLGPAGH